MLLLSKVIIGGQEIPIESYFWTLWKANSFPAGNYILSWFPGVQGPRTLSENKYLGLHSALRDAHFLKHHKFSYFAANRSPTCPNKLRRKVKQGYFKGPYPANKNLSFTWVRKVGQNCTLLKPYLIFSNILPTKIPCFPPCNWSHFLRVKTFLELFDWRSWQFFANLSSKDLTFMKFLS